MQHIVSLSDVSQTFINKTTSQTQMTITYAVLCT